MSEVAPVSSLSRLRRGWRLALLLCLGGLMAGLAQAQFSLVPRPMQHDEITPSAASNEAEYRVDAAKHLYASYPMHVFRGQLPPLLYAVAVIETDVDEAGQITDVRMTREPAAAKEVGPWLVSLVRKVKQLPSPAKIGKHTYTETWLVDKSGRFQVHTLSEGQRSQ